MTPPTELEPTPARQEGSKPKVRRRILPPPEPPRFAFVGGTGRSGTHVVAKLINRNSAYQKVPNEARFHVNPKGFPDLLAGRVSLDGFLHELRGQWWRGHAITRPSDEDGFSGRLTQRRGLHRYVPEERFQAAVARFESSFEGDPEAACRELYIDLLWPLAEEAGSVGLVEQSCDTVAEAPTLLRLFPEARFLHAVRDGRDAAASRVGQARWLVPPRTMSQGLRWWEERIRRIDAGIKQIPNKRFLVVSLDELSEFRRRRVYRRICRFLALEQEPPMRRFWRNRITPARAKRGRWRGGMSDRRQRLVEEIYDEVLRRLERDEVHCARVLRRNFERRRLRAAQEGGEEA
jgi:hypothetical protein